MPIYTNINGVWQDTPLMTSYNLESPNYFRDGMESPDLTLKSIAVSPHMKVDGVWHGIKEFSEDDITRAIFYIYPSWVVDSRHRAWKTVDDIGVYISGNTVTFDFKLVNEQKFDWEYIAARSMMVLFEDRFGELWTLDYFHSHLSNGRSEINYQPEGKYLRECISSFDDRNAILNKLPPVRIGKFVHGIWIRFRRQYIYSGGGFSNWYERLFFRDGGNTAQYEDYNTDFPLVSATAHDSMNMAYGEHVMIGGKKTSHDTSFRCEFTVQNVHMNGRYSVPVSFIDLGDFRDYNP